MIDGSPMCPSVVVTQSKSLHGVITKLAGDNGTASEYVHGLRRQEYKIIIFFIIWLFQNRCDLYVLVNLHRINVYLRCAYGKTKK